MANTFLPRGQILVAWPTHVLAVYYQPFRNYNQSLYLIKMLRPLLSFVTRRCMSQERTVNKITLVGRVGSDAQLKGNEDHPVVIFSLATSSNQKTEWHRISVFRAGLRELAEEYVKSGSRLMVEGKVSYGHIIDRNGTAVPTTSIIADDIIFLSIKNNPEPTQQ